VLWNVIDRVGQLVVGVAALVLAAWLWRKIASNWDKWGSFDDEKMLFPVALVIAVVVAVIFTASGGIGIAQATLAPRVFFIMSCKELLTR
jgi:small-conductance mechanosensitive channel